MSEIISKFFPKHLMERADFLRYANEIGETTITITYDADYETGKLTVNTPDPNPIDWKELRKRLLDAIGAANTDCQTVITAISVIESDMQYVKPALARKIPASTMLELLQKVRQ